MIKIYSKPDCVQCTMTYKALNARKLTSEIIDITKDEKAYEYIQSLGYSRLPVVVTESQHWAGFRPDKIKEL
ncbi:glutaredoxin-like protein NrdH [Bartonella sp. CB175]|uniref:glutaredoxin-like protein NrdH n=1 Tax=Bartonella sp. CB175 TaxID=3112256 RepID=UPI00300E32B2